MAQVTDPHLHPVFQPDSDHPARALVVAGACGNVGFGKLGQFARLLGPKGVPIVALDPSPTVAEIPARLRQAYGDRFSADEVNAIIDGLHVVRGGIGDLPSDLPVGFVFEAIPERLGLKHAFYREMRARDPEAFIFSATSGFPSTMLFDDLPGKERCGVMHPFFPHLTNKLWEVPTRGAVTGKDELKTIRRLLSTLGMNVLEVADVPCFAADRLFCGMMLEAVRIHADLGLGPAQIDDVCRQVLGTSPFYVHNMIPGANYLSAHCMELMTQEVDSTLFEIPEIWKPYTKDPHAKWPYEKGQRCPPEQFGVVRDRMIGMLLSLTAYMIEHEIAPLAVINFLCENALAFRQGTPALVEQLGFEKARELTRAFVEGQKVTKAEEVAPLGALSEHRPGWWRNYVDISVHDGVGLLSLKRLAINDTFIAELDRALQTLQDDDAVKAIVVAPDGTFSREFGHGADLQAFVPVLGKEADALALIQRWKKTLGKLRGGKPTVAALVGRVLGGSLEMAAQCDARIAAERTRLQFPETTVGVIPGLGGCHLLHRFSKPEAQHRIDEVLLTGHGFTAEEARDWGFVSEVVSVKELPARSMKLAAALGGGQPKPAFRDGGADVKVNRDVSSRNEAGVPLDADLRDLLARTIEDANAASFEEGSKVEEQRAAQSLAVSSSKIGVTAMLRGKPPQFEKPLDG